MQKLKAIITGSIVHDVGYRVMLTNKALSFGVNNFNTFNTHLNGTQAVIAIIEAEDEVIEEYKNFVNNFFPKKSIVENISFEEYKNFVPPIERVMQAFQMEQWGKAIPVLVEMLEKQDFHIEITRNGFNDLKDEMKETRDELKYEIKATRDELKYEIKATRDELKYEMKETRDELKCEIKEMRSDMNAGFAGIKEEVRMQRDDFKEVFMKEVEGLHNEINEIRATLAGMQNGQEV